MSRRSTWAACFVCMVLLASTACEEREDSLGLGIQDDGDFINVEIREDVALQMSTVRADSVLTSLLSRALIGDMTHPTYGRTQSLLNTQFRLSSLGATFDSEATVTDAVVDSIVLSLKYFDDGDNGYGTAEPMVFSVKELDDTLSFFSAYYSNTIAEVLSEELLLDPMTAITPRPETEVILAGDTLDPQLRLRLSNQFGERLVESSRDASGPFANSTDFLEVFKGLQISAVNQGALGGIFTYDLLDIDSKLTLYYHNALDTLEYDFLINTDAQRYMTFAHDYTGTPIETLIDLPAVDEQALHVQALAGLNVSVDCQPIIDSLSNLAGALNKVELIYTVNDAMNAENFPFPERIFARYINEDGFAVIIPDLSEGDTHSDGFYDEDKGTYSVNITRYAQRLLNGEIVGTTLRLLPTSNSITPNFVSLSGPGSMIEPAKLRITYTKFE